MRYLSINQWTSILKYFLWIILCQFYKKEEINVLFRKMCIVITSGQVNNLSGLEWYWECTQFIDAQKQTKKKKVN